MLWWQALVDADIPMIFFQAYKRCQVNAGLQGVGGPGFLQSYL